MKQNTCLIFDPDTLSQNCIKALIQSINPNFVFIQVHKTQDLHHTDDCVPNFDYAICRCDGWSKHAIDVLKTVITRSPQSQILVISSNQSIEFMTSLAEIGVKNVINSKQTYELLKENICAFIHQNAVDDMPSSYAQIRLTQRQQEVMHWILQGLSNKRIALEMSVSEGTVKLHVSSILKTLKATNRTEAAMKYQHQHMLLSNNTNYQNSNLIQ